MREKAKRDDPKIPSGGVALLTRVKQACMDDNDLSLKITQCGGVAAAHYIDDLITNAFWIESLYRELRISNELWKQTAHEFYALLGMYPEELTDEQKADLAALTAKWNAAENELCREDT